MSEPIGWALGIIAYAAVTALVLLVDNKDLKENDDARRNR